MFWDISSAFKDLKISDSKKFEVGVEDSSYVDMFKENINLTHVMETQVGINFLIFTMSS